MGLPAPQSQPSVSVTPAAASDTAAPLSIANAIEACTIAYCQAQTALFKLIGNASIEDAVTGTSAAIEKLEGPDRAYTCLQAIRLFGLPFGLSLDLFELIIGTLTDVRGLYDGHPHPVIEEEGELLLGSGGGFNIQISAEHPQLPIFTDVAKACCFAAVACGQPEWVEIERNGHVLPICRQAGDFRQAMYDYLASIYQVNVEEEMRRRLQEAVVDDDADGDAGK